MSTTKSTTLIDATVFDSAPPIGIRSWPALVCLVAIIAIGVVGPWREGASFAGVLAWLLAWDLRPRRRPQQTHVLCKLGSIEISGVGVIRARDLIGATTARNGSRVSLMLSHRRRKNSPIILDLDSDEALVAVCRSLGIGHHGFGYVDLLLESPRAERLRYATSPLAFALIAAACLAPAFAEELVPLAVLGAIVVGIATLARISTLARPLRITYAGLFVPLAQKSESPFVPFNSIERVEHDGRHLVLDIADSKEPIVADANPVRLARHGASVTELAHVVAQIRAAAQRAHGKFALKHEPHALVDQLRRLSTESLREWLARMDTIGIGAGGYRATSLEADELWAVLEDPEAEPEIRGGAARILSRVLPDQVRVRVAGVLDTVRDERMRKRIAASIDDDVLAEEEQLEAATKPLRPQDPAAHS